MFSIRIVVLGMLCIPAFTQQAQGPLTNERVGGLVLAGVSQGEIIRIISSARAVNFDLRPNSTDALLSAGVSEDVIKAMAARESGAAAVPASGSSLPHSSLPLNARHGHWPTEQFGNVEYIHKGSDGKGYRDGGHLLLSSASIGFQRDQNTELAVSIDHVNRVVYERASKPRYAAGLLIAWPLLFTKSKQHFMTVQYNDGGEGRYAIFRLSKTNYREVLAAAEAATGQKIDRQEER